MPFYAICPYYRYDKKKQIGCELKNISFPTQADKNNWMINLCCSFDYKHCAQAIKLNEKYIQKYGEF